MATTIGIDLASQPEHTAASSIAWSRDEARIAFVQPSVGDERFLELVTSTEAVRVALDVPLGWPDAFVKALTRYHAGEPWGEMVDPPPEKRLTHRATDRWIHDQPDLGIWPLSVSTDRIAYPAMRVARLLGQIGEVDRSGGGRVVEAYPAAALKRWGLDSRLYKRASGQPNLTCLVTDLRARVPWLHGDDSDWGRIERDDNAFDALVCAIVARAVDRSECEEIPPLHRDMAQVEGWIHIPKEGSLQRLLG